MKFLYDYLNSVVEESKLEQGWDEIWENYLRRWATEFLQRMWNEIRVMKFVEIDGPQLRATKDIKL